MRAPRRVRWFDTERESWGDWARYLWCRVIGHETRRDDPHQDWYCTRCSDVMPRGKTRWQP